MIKFKRIYVEITNICNLSCSFCPQNDRTKEFMDIATFEDILKKIKPYTDYIYLHIKGEPLMHKNILEFMDLATKYGMKVNITSNGTILNEEILKKESLRQINFSLHSFEDEQNIEKEKYLNDILNYAVIASEQHKKIISLRLWNLTDNNFNDNKSTLSKIEEFFDYKFDEKEFQRGRGIKLKDKIYLNFETVFVWPTLDTDFYEEKGFCHGLNSHLGILVDGTVIPCCLDEKGIINLGNIKKNSLEEILESQRVKNIIDGFEKRYAAEELCKKCQFKSRF